jgi:hypothetical protein
MLAPTRRSTRRPSRPADATPGPITAQPDAGILAVKQNEYNADGCPVVAA